MTTLLPVATWRRGACAGGGCGGLVAAAEGGTATTLERETVRARVMKWVLTRLRLSRQRIEELVDLLHIGVVELVMGRFASDRRQRFVPDLRVVRHHSGNARGRGSGSRCFFRTDRGLGGEVEKREHRRVRSGQKRERGRPLHGRQDRRWRLRDRQ